MKVVSWNVNSIKSRLPQVLSFMEQNSPDILLLQELKCEESTFPYEAFSHLPYNYAIVGQKTYNGVAILSKYLLDDIKINFPNNPCPEQARFVEATFRDNEEFYRVISVYVPNGGEIHSDKFEMKLQFLTALQSYLKSIKRLDENILIGGDFNVAPFDIDVHAPQHLQHTTCFTIGERSLMRSILNIDWLDLYRVIHPNINEYSWWDYRAKSFEHNQGMRIDTILGNPLVGDKIKEFIIHKDIRAQEKASDHAPIMAVL